MESLLRELVSNVLSRLPAKELIRCKCVCKFWYDLIIDPHFISNYYLFYNSRQEQLLVISNPSICNYDSEGEEEEVQFCDTQISILSWNPKGIVSSQSINPPPNHRCEVWGPLIMGPCNGIYFLEGIPSVLMNPSLGQFITLLQCQIPPPHGMFSEGKFFNFGFDPKTNDYKVVVISEHWLEESYGPLIEGYWTVELYSFNSNSWRGLDAPAIPFATGDMFGLCTSVNNCCHWRGYLSESEGYMSHDVENVVMSFDMVTELFRKINVPQSIHSRGLCSKLTAFTESATIGLVVYPGPGSRGTEDNFCFEVWMMKDYWDDESWIKRYSVSSMPTIYERIVGFYGSNRFLWKDANNTLVLYGLDCDDHTRDLQVYGNDESVRAVRYVESIVSLQRGNLSSGNQQGFKLQSSLYGQLHRD